MNVYLKLCVIESMMTLNGCRGVHEYHMYFKIHVTATPRSTFSSEPLLPGPCHPPPPHHHHSLPPGSHLDVASRSPLSRSVVFSALLLRVLLPSPLFCLLVRLRVCMMSVWLRLPFPQISLHTHTHTHTHGYVWSHQFPPPVLQIWFLSGLFIAVDAHSTLCSASWPMFFVRKGRAALKSNFIRCEIVCLFSLEQFSRNRRKHFLFCLVFQGF